MRPGAAGPRRRPCRDPAGLSAPGLGRAGPARLGPRARPRDRARPRRGRRRAADVVAIGVSGQLDGAVPVDAAGAAIGPCLVWLDRRAAGDLPASIRRGFAALTGQVADGGHLAAKIRWLERHRPGAARYHLPVSYVVERLAGVAAWIRRTRRRRCCGTWPAARGRRSCAPRSRSIPGACPRSPAPPPSPARSPPPAPRSPASAPAPRSRSAPATTSRPRSAPASSPPARSPAWSAPPRSSARPARRPSSIPGRRAWSRPTPGRPAATSSRTRAGWPAAR